MGNTSESNKNSYVDASSKFNEDSVYRIINEVFEGASILSLSPQTADLEGNSWLVRLKLSSAAICIPDRTDCHLAILKVDFEMKTAEVLVSPPDSTLVWSIVNIPAKDLMPVLSHVQAVFTDEQRARDMLADLARIQHVPLQDDFISIPLSDGTKMLSVLRKSKLLLGPKFNPQGK